MHLLPAGGALRWLASISPPQARAFDRDIHLGAAEFRSRAGYRCQFRCSQRECGEACIPIIGQHCAELRELQLPTDGDNTQVRRKQLLRALDARRPSSVSLLPCLERLRVCMLDDAAVYLLLHRLQVSPLQLFDVEQAFTILSPSLLGLFCQCLSVRAIRFSPLRYSSPVIDVLTQRDYAYQPASASCSDLCHC